MSDIGLASIAELRQEILDRCVAQEIPVIIAIKGDSSGKDSGYAGLNFNGRVDDYVDMMAMTGIQLLSETKFDPVDLYKHVIIRMHTIMERE